MNPLFKAHAIKSGQIFWDPRLCAPIVTFWNNSSCLPQADGGLTFTATGDDPISNILRSDSNASILGFVNFLEAQERWLEIGGGTTAVNIDLAALKDLIDMSYDIVPGTWVPGLPRADEMPGIINDRSGLTEHLARCMTVKREEAVTDQWTWFPSAKAVSFDGRFPVTGFGTPSIYDFTYFGAPKFVIKDADAVAVVCDVNGDVRVPGTDFLCDNHVYMKSSTTYLGVDAIFGSKTGTDQVNALKNTASALITSQHSMDWTDLSDIQSSMLEKDDTYANHIWKDLMLNCDLGDFFDADDSSMTAIRQVEGAKYDYIFYADAEDYGDNTAQLYSSVLGIPYFRG
jgi:hypothetical protein